MLELYSTLSPALILCFMMVSVLAVILQALYFSWMQGYKLLKAFEALIGVHLILLSMILRAVNRGLNSSTVLVGIYDPFRRTIGLLIIITGIAGYAVSKKRLILVGILLTSLTLPLMEKLPYEGYTLCLIVSLLLFIIRAYILYKAKRKKQKTKITEYSIKEAIDAQHSGVLFAETGGNILLTNKQMLSLMKQLTGKHQRNAENFWMFLSETASPYIQCDDLSANVHYLRTADGSIWQFRRQRISRQGKDIYQMIATDVTEQEAINQKLKHYKSQLEEQRDQLYDVLENVEELCRQEAHSRTWNHIHDVLGQRISMLQRMLRTEPAPHREDLEPLMKNLREDLIAVQEESPGEILRDLASSFASLGVHLHREGNLPKDEAIAKIFVAIIREGVTNAVRHGQAQNIHIKLAEGEGCALTITNDGNPSPETILWGGGLQEINRKTKEMGGYLQIQTRPKFSLHIEIPNTIRKAESRLNEFVIRRVKEDD